MFDLSAMSAPRLVGRDDVLQLMHTHLSEGVLIVSRRGGTGMGATALARRLASESLEAYPDGRIEIDLRGNIPGRRAQPALEHVHRRVLMILNPEAKLPRKPRALRKQYLETLSERKVLLVLVNVASAAQLRALLPRSGSTAVVTSQSDLASSFPRLHIITLEGLAADDVYHLMVQSAPEAPNLPRWAVHRIADRLNSIPLALRIVAPLMSRTNQLSPRELLHNLELAQQRVVALHGSQTTDTPIDVAIEISYDLLSFELKQYFEALAIFPAPFTKSAAAAVWKISTAEAGDLLARLSRLALVDHHATSAWYEVHQRVRCFAEELLLGQPERSEELVSRYVGYYLRAAIQAGATLSARSARSKNQKLDPYAIWEHVPIAWYRLTGEDPGWPKPPGMDRWIRDFPLQSRPLLNVLLPRTEYRDWLALALSAAEIESNPRTLGAHLGALGQAYAELDEHEVALTYFERQITVAREARARDIEAEALMSAGSSYGALGHVQRASADWRKALVIFEVMGDQRAERVRLWLAQLQESH
jgi:tetratricopeptide (TPR) repeat protein